MAFAFRSVTRRLTYGLVLLEGLKGVASATETPPAEAHAATDLATGLTPEGAEGKDRSGWIAVPVAGFSPETSVQLGGLLIYFFDLDEKSSLSSLPVLAIGTFKEQVLIEVRPELFFDGDNYRVWTRIDLQRYPDSFFGVGNRVREADKEPYQRAFARVRTNLRRRVVGDLHAGILTDHIEMDLELEQPNGLFATRDYLGEEGGLTGGVGATVAYDSRDHKNYPTRGFFIESSLTPFISGLGSDYSFLRGVLDARAYLPLGHERLFAFQYYLESAGGKVPFYMLPQLGGADLVRGYFRGKFRDESLHAAQAEFRAHLFWRIRGVAFASVGQIASDYSSMWTAPFRPSIGTGVRYNMKSPDDIVNFRVDFGWSPVAGDVGLYVAATEAF